MIKMMKNKRKRSQNLEMEAKRPQKRRKMAKNDSNNEYMAKNTENSGSNNEIMNEKLDGAKNHKNNSEYDFSRINGADKVEYL